MKKTLFSILVCLCVNSLFSQSESSINFQIKDKSDNTPLSYATMTILSFDSNDTLAVYVSDSLGTVSIKKNFQVHLPLLIVSTNAGYFQKVDTLKDWNDQIILLERNEKYIQTVIVSGNRVQRDVDKLSYKIDHTKIPEGVKITRIMKDVPLLTYNSVNGLLYKGFQDVIIKYNDKVISLDLFKTLVADNIGSIEITYNPSVAEVSGSETKPIIHLVVKKSLLKKQSVSVGVVGGTLQPLFFPSLNYNLISPKLSLMLGVSSQSNNQRSNSTTIRTNLTTNEGVYENQIETKTKINVLNSYSSFYYTIDTTQELNGSIDFSNNKYKINSNFIDNFIIQKFTGYSSLENQSERFSGGLGYSKKLKNQSKLKIDLDYSNIHTNMDNIITNQFLNSAMDSSDYKFSNNTKSHYYSIQTLYTGTLFSSKRIYQIGGQYVSGQSQNTFHSIFSEQDKVSLETILNQAQLALFASTKFDIKDFSTRVGLRYERLQQSFENFDLKFNYRNLFPNLVLLYKFNHKTSIFLNYQRKIQRQGINSLNPARFKYGNGNEYGGNILLKPAFNNKLDVNLNLNYEKIFWEFTAYTNYFKNPIVYRTVLTDTVSRFSYINLRNLWVWGLNITNKMTISDKLTMDITLYGERYRYSKEFKLPKIDGFIWASSVNANYEINHIFSSYLSFNYTNREYSYQKIT